MEWKRISDDNQKKNHTKASFGYTTAILTFSELEFHAIERFGRRCNVL